MKIGIIGSGNVGGVLGSRWAGKGHTVKFSTRDPESQKIKALLGRAGSNASAATASEAAKTSDVVLLAAPWPLTKEMLAAAGDLTDKILIDATNPFLPDLSGMEVGTTSSAGELVASWAPGAKVVKAFNTVGNNIMADPVLSGQSAQLFYCGDDDLAKKIVHDLAAELGFDPRDAVL